MNDGDAIMNDGDAMARYRYDYEKLKYYARMMRKYPTVEERKLWQRLRRRQLKEAYFRRQHILAPFIVDFCCVRRRLIVEIDGYSHRGRSRADARREQYLRAQFQMRVLRIEASEVLYDIEQVLGRISRML